MCGQEHGGARFLQLPQTLPHQVAGIGVQPCGRLIQNQKFRLVNQCPAYGQAPFQAAGEVLHHRAGDDWIIFTNRGQKLSTIVSEKAASLGISLNYRRLRPANLEDVFLKLTGETLTENE